MKISIVTTAYNVESYIEQCLSSILEQTYKNIELILVNDCSTDGTMKIVNKFNDERLKIINHKENLGAGWARRHGIDASTGEYVITIDGDDWISEDFIEKLVENAKETNADIISGGITIVHNDEYQEIKRFVPMISTGFKKFKDYDDKKIIFLNNKLVRRTMYETTPYCTRRYCEDTPVILPLLYYANMVSYVDTQGYFYRQHQASLCKRVNSFEDALFKALCCKELITFFSDKEGCENIINTNEFLQYVGTLKVNITPELSEKYKLELGELMPLLLTLIQ
jgi:glycosyltransferase involved in cell wall biosynthesis